MDVNTRSQKLATEVLGTALLVYIGVGSIPAMKIVDAKAWHSGLGVASYGAGVGSGQAFFAEFIGTFILVLVVFGVIHRKAPAGWVGLAVGLAVFAIIMVVGPATSAAINPARVIAPMLALQIFGGSVKWSQAPVYVSAELLAGVAAAAVYALISRTAADRAVEVESKKYAADVVVAEPAA